MLMILWIWCNLNHFWNSSWEKNSSTWERAFKRPGKESEVLSYFSTVSSNKIVPIRPDLEAVIVPTEKVVWWRGRNLMRSRNSMMKLQSLALWVNRFQVIQSHTAFIPSIIIIGLNHIDFSITFLSMTSVLIHTQYEKFYVQSIQVISKVSYQWIDLYFDFFN